MALIPWKPFMDMDRFFGDDDFFMPVFPRINEPAMDVYEEGNNVMAKVQLPGIDPENVDITVKDGILRVSGSMKEEDEHKDGGYWRREIRTGSFERAVRLPAHVNEDSVTAEYDKGILIVTMPKSDKRDKLEKKISITIKGK